MTFAEKLTDKERRRARIMAYCSTWFGGISEVMIDSSAIIIIYISMLGGSDSVSMFTTGISSISFMLLMIPCAVIIPRIGMRKAVKISCIIGFLGYLLVALSPYFGASAAKYAALAGCMIFALQRPLYATTWYPMLDQFLLPEERGDFFGTMRFSYMLLSGGIFFLIGLLMGQQPPLALLQIIIAAAGIMVLGQYYFIARFPSDPDAKAEKTDIRKALRISLHNGPLVGYSIYVCLFSAAYISLYPLILIYLKSFVNLSAGTVQLISSLGIAGSIAGYFFYGRLLRRTSLKIMELGAHAIMTITAFILFFYTVEMPCFIGVMCAAVFVVMFAQSCHLCNNSAELLALARPGNKLMAMAFSQSYAFFESAVGRGISSVMIGSAMLSTTWDAAWGSTYCSFQTLFLISGVLLTFLCILIPMMPSVIRKHEYHGEPASRK